MGFSWIFMGFSWDFHGFSWIFMGFFMWTWKFTTGNNLRGFTNQPDSAGWSWKSGWFQQKHRTFPARHRTISATKQGLHTRADCYHRKSGHFRDKVVKSRDLAITERPSCEILRVMVWMALISWAQGDGPRIASRQLKNISLWWTEVIV